MGKPRSHITICIRQTSTIYWKGAKIGQQLIPLKSGFQHPFLLWNIKNLLCKHNGGALKVEIGSQTSLVLSLRRPEGLVTRLVETECLIRCINTRSCAKIPAKIPAKIRKKTKASPSEMSHPGSQTPCIGFSPNFISCTLCKKNATDDRKERFEFCLDDPLW